MKFSVEQAALVNVLSLCCSIADRKHTMPILANVKLLAEDNKLKISSTDLEISLYAEIQAEVIKPGSVAVPAKVFFEIVRLLDEERVEFNLDESRLVVSCGESNYKIVITSALEFPSLTGVEIKNPVLVDSDKLYEMFNKTLFSICSDESRYNINGLFIETLENNIGQSKSGIRLVSTDGHRISIIERPADGFSLKKGILVPKKGISELIKFLANSESNSAQVEVVDGYFTIKSGEIVLGVRLSDGVFPNYKQVLPKNKTTTITLACEDFISAVKKVSIVTTEMSKSIVFKLKSGVLELFASSQENGEAKAKLNNITQSGEDVLTSFSARYLLELLSIFNEKDEEVILNLDGGEGPCSFSFKSDENYNCIIMPMRISENIKQAA
ncbi:MAG: DNA polymerase III subunit beta [Deltaproteobacteria bacterium]|jgi:DNA polymerase-3 subunit beta|nr:DNA polymerase III subunit beta [Deltaproteobacteria bacterium]